MINVKKISSSDVLGITASGLCAIHCAITPLIFVAKPILENTSTIHSHSHWWALFDLLFMVLSLFAVYYSSKQASSKTMKWLFWLAWMIFTVGLFFEFIHVQFGIWLMYFGSISLIVIHFKNHLNHQKYSRNVCK